MNLHFKRVLAPSASNQPAAAPVKKQCTKLSKSAEMEESDVSLSDNDDDEPLKLARSMTVQSSKCDGKVTVPMQSNVFLKIADERVRQNQIAQTILGATGRLPGQSRSSSDALHSSAPQRAVSSIGRANPQTASTVSKVSGISSETYKNNLSTNLPSNIPSSLPTNMSSNSILGATATAKNRISTNPSVNTGTTKDLRMVGSILLSSNRLIQNSVANQNISATFLGQKMNLKTGNAVLDKLHFGAGNNGNDGYSGNNNRRNIGQNQINIEEKENMLREKTLEKKKAESLEIEQLLGKKSSHAEERESEWFDGFELRTSKLADKEEFRKKIDTVVNTFIRANHCVECRIITESDLAMQLCSQKEHNISKIKAVKWFFECGVCERRESTLSAAPSSNSSSHGQSTGRGDPNNNKIQKNQKNNLPDTEIVSGNSSKQHPTRRCQCGGFSWRSCSKYGTNEGTSIKADQRIILSASEWTSRKDLNTLDTIRSSVL